MVNLTHVLIVLGLLFAFHFIGDFILQSRKMARKKSSSFNTLLLHSIVYGLPFLILTRSDFIIDIIVSHFFIDGVSSQIAKYHYQRDDDYSFFCIVGFDQFLHVLVILISFYYNYNEIMKGFVNG